MKTMKKLCALAIAIVIMLAMTVTTFAATVTNSGPSGHTYTAYQILKGTQAVGEDGKTHSGALGDVEWGSEINSESFLTALKAEGSSVKEKFKDANDAATFAKAMGELADKSADAIAVAQIAYKHTKGDGTIVGAGETADLATGYYLIVDTTTKVEGTDSALNAALLQVTDSIIIGNKTDKPTVEKKVQENTKASNEKTYGDGYNDVADYNIGDAVPFKLIGAVPDTTNYEKYTTYTFTDTLGNGFTAPQSSEVSVFYATDKAALTGTDLKTNFFDVSVEGQKITVSLKDNVDLKNATDTIKKSGYIIVTYTAKLNNKAVIGLNGNVNEVYLEYTNTPNVKSDGVPGTGKTKEDKVIVFTYELDTTKIDGATAKDENPKKLKGAEFVLYKEVSGAAKYAKLDENFKVSEWVDSEESATTLKSGEDGLFKVIGLDDGTYKLKETKAPAGYNLLTKDITVKVTASTNTTQKWDEFKAEDALTGLDVTADGVKGTGAADSGIANITVANNQGAVLPSTGGMGTTIFYIVGAVLVVGAGVVLVTRKRMKNTK